MTDKPTRPTQLNLEFESAISQKCSDQVSNDEVAAENSNVIPFAKALEMHREELRRAALRSIISSSDHGGAQEG